MTNNQGPDKSKVQRPDDGSEMEPAAEHFKPSFAELLRYFGGRAAERGSLRARARGEERRAALRAYVFAHTRRLLVWVIASACFVLIGGPDVPTDTAPARTVSAFGGREPTDVR